MERIEDLLVAGGYFRARISSLSPFDKLTGGLAWCIAASNVDVDYDHLDYSDDLILGEKIKIGEAIESALQRMGCPYPLQAHQIQGLDYPAVLPVVQWLVKRVLDTRNEIGDLLRRYSHFQFSKNYELPIQHRSKDYNDTIRAHAEDPQSGHLQHISRQSRNLQLFFDRNIRAEYTVLKYGSKSAQSEAVSKQWELIEASESKFDGEVHNDPYDQKIDELRNKLERSKERLSVLVHGIKKASLLDKRDHIDEQTRAKESVLSEIAKLRMSSDVSKDQDTLDNVIGALKLLTLLEREKVAFVEASRDDRNRMERQLNSLKESLSTAGENILEKKTCLRKELAKLSRDVVVLKRRVDDVPTQLELIQYERCFMELYVNIQAKLRETRKYYASYNALVEANELSLKEISLLNSINDQYEKAMATSEGRPRFVESMQEISKGAQRKLQKMENRCSEKKTTYDSLKTKHGAAVAKRRQYYALLKQLQEEFTRNEKLKTQ
ncbi:coiled-coil domain-containing protein 93 isoform X1 [Selaginella moellendorffii]|uniref:coiled-coil domain-containing protein 93 isoform X1 n=1 Tax=Selaginella moellendorffii TaxID=88036 RepID=UPI000D1C4F41|nr:coiled-coil domain-containing protein 93 isoform X1 [Selaginella moellendorffii]|eukprot:XP_024520967.1 coiled-coil domain-containing protein 93 isoform X1 [Selaginella moellendorffii]